MRFFRRVANIVYRYGKSFEHTHYVEKLKRRGLQVGKNLKIMQDVIIDDTHCWHILIGDDVTLAPRVHILAHDASTKTHLGYTKIGKVTIGDRVFIGASSIVMPGVTIGNDVIIGAGSIVTTDIPSGSVAVGHPANVISDLESFLKKRRAEMEEFPLFDESYTMKCHVNDDMKKEMNSKMKDGYGYIV